MPPASSSSLRLWHDISLIELHVRVSLDRRLRAVVGCSVLDHDFLAWLAAAPGGRSRMREIADRLHISPGGATKVGDRLAERGWIDRRTPPENRREVHVALTREGTAALRRARAAYREVLEESVGRHLDETQIQAFTELTGALLDALRGPRPRGAPPSSAGDRRPADDELAVHQAGQLPGRGPVDGL